MISSYCHSQCYNSDLPISEGDGDGDGDGDGNGAGDDDVYFTWFIIFHFITGSASISSTLFFPNTANVYFSGLSTDIVTGNSVDLLYFFSVRRVSLYSL